MYSPGSEVSRHHHDGSTERSCIAWRTSDKAVIVSQTQSDHEAACSAVLIDAAQALLKIFKWREHKLVPIDGLKSRLSRGHLQGGSLAHIAMDPHQQEFSPHS